MEMRLFCQAEIHFELDSFVFEGDGEHSASAEKVCGFANSEGARALHERDNFCVARYLGTADEQDVTSTKLLVVANPSHRDVASVRSGITRDFGESRAEAEFPKNADDERRILGGKGAVGPIDETGERGEECCLAAVFAWDGILRGGDEW